MKRIWNLALGTAVLCTVLLCGCALSGPTAPDSAAPTDPLTGQELQYPGERIAAVVIDNAASSTTQWGIGSASVVLEALTESGQPTSLCLAYPSVSAMPTVGPVTLGQDLYWRLLSGQEVLPIQRGAGQFARNYLDYYNLRAVDALEVGRNAFSCDDVWSGAPLWHTSGAEVASVLGSLNLSGALGDHGSSASSSASTAEDSSVISALPALLPQAKEPRLPEPVPGMPNRCRSTLRPKAPPALPTMRPAAPTGCSVQMAPPSWMPTPARRRNSTICWSFSPLPACGTTAPRWTTTCPLAAVSG